MTRFDGGCSFAGRLALQADGKVVVSGSTFTRGHAQAVFAMARFFGDSHILRVRIRGSDKGKVVSKPIGLACKPTCSADFADQIWVTLQAKPRRATVFSWGGDCVGARRTCRLHMSTPRSASITFRAICLAPNVRGKTLPKARRLIRRSHCKVGRVRRVYSGSVEKGHVISQRPRPETKRSKGAKVRLVVSKGKRR